jgi:hypothetical protein
MKSRIAVGAALTAVLLVGSAWAAGSLESGPQKGKNIPGPFHPLNITGSGAGQKLCQV